jgi:hypothetical protein
VETLIDNDDAVLRYHLGSKIVHHEFRRFIHGEPFREILTRGAEVLQKRGAIKWLSDDRNNGPIKPADAEWASKVWIPKVLAAGWKHWAVVLPEKTLGQMNMMRWIETYAALGISAQPFEKVEDAKRWLEELPSS